MFRKTFREQWCLIIIVSLILIGIAFKIEYSRVMNGVWKTPSLILHMQLLMIVCVVWCSEIEITRLIEKYGELLYAFGCLFMFAGLFFNPAETSEASIFFTLVTEMGLFSIWEKERYGQEKSRNMIRQFSLVLIPLLLAVVGHQSISIILLTVSLVAYLAVNNTKVILSKQCVISTILLATILIVIGCMFMGSYYYRDRILMFLGIGTNYQSDMITMAFDNISFIGHSLQWMQSHIQAGLFFGLPIDTWNTNLILLFVFLKWGAMGGILFFLPVIFFAYFSIKMLLNKRTLNGENRITAIIIICAVIVLSLLHLLLNLGILGFGSNVPFPFIGNNYALTILLLVLSRATFQRHKNV